MSLLENYLTTTLVAHFLLSIVNSLFTLVDINATISLFGFYGVVQHDKRSLLAFIGFSSVSLVMDAVRLGAWGNYITNHLLGTLGSLGTYYLVLTCFGALVKIIACLLSLLLYKRIVRIEKEPLLALHETPRT